MLALLVLGITPLSTPRPSPAFTACMKNAGGVSTAMLMCGKAEVARWDARLNAAYRTFLARGTPAQRTALRAEQRRWLAHHLAEARRLADAPDNGSVAFLESQSFELADLSARTATLEYRVRN